jgi:hypothetical protein
MKKVNIKSIDKCWEWKGAKIPDGRGHFRIGNKLILAHRFSYLLFHFEINDDLLVCHKCDNAGCVNPFHLFQGTTKDNCEDKYKKGRQGKMGRKLSLKETEVDGSYLLANRKIHKVLPEGQELVWVYFKQGLSVNEICDKMSISRNLVKTILVQQKHKEVI